MAAPRFLRPSSLFFALVLALSPVITFCQNNPEAELLLQLKSSLIGAENALVSWQPDSPPCGMPEWLGVKCVNGAVSSVRLVAMGLSGDIDVAALEKLPNLRTLSLVNNSFAGPIPPFNRLPALKTLFLSENYFSGEIPGNYFENQKNLKKLWLDTNRFTGNLPASIVNLSHVIVLHLENNRFSGPIPAFNRLDDLKLLFLSNNSISGDIPEDYFENRDNLRKVWLDNNRFTGKIPASVANLSNIIELHLDNNQFTGPIPSLGQESLTDLDLSNNKLQGRVPAAMERFDARAFAGNEALCGENLPKKCNNTDEGSENEETKKAESPTAEEKKKEMSIAAVSTLIAMLLSLLLIILIMRKVRGNKEDHSSAKVRRGNTITAVAAQMVTAVSKSGRKVGFGSARRTAAAAMKRKVAMGDLVMLNDEKGSFGMPDLMKASAEILGNAGVGSTYKAVMGNGLSVVVKRMRDNNGKESKEFDMEAKRLGRLRHHNILSPLSYYYRPEEKLFVYEYVSKGSLFYQLHGDHGGLDWPQRLKIVKGIAKGMSYLHKELAPSPLPHGNLKSSNIFLGNDFNPLLSEFGFFSLFGPKVAAQMLVAFKSPEAIQDGQVTPKSDVFCVGIMILEILSGKLPSISTNGMGGTDLVDLACSKGKSIELLDSNIASSTNSTTNMESLLEIAKACIENSPDDRLDMEEALERIESIQV